MEADPAVLAALEATLVADPHNAAVRVHLASLLESAGRPAEALAHCRTVLDAAPAHGDALAIAARAARACGDPAADGYERLATALGAVPSADGGSDREVGADSTPIPGRAAVPASADPLDAELDALLANEALDSDIEAVATTLADVGGLEDVKRQLELSFLGPMRNPELRKMYGKSLRGGLLLFGPPGCGKTFLARAVAGELGANFYSVGLHEVLDMYLGRSEQNVHRLFDTARRNTPCVLFLDELDALGQKRSHLTHSAGRNVVVQLLSELDGLESENEGVFVLAATNQLWDLDPAVRRPGRFDRTILVLPPDPPAREAILAYHLRDRPVGAVDVRRIARSAEGFSGADLRLVCEGAAELALEASLQTGRARPIEHADVEASLARITPSTTTWFDVARNFVTFANAHGEYDALAAYMRKRGLL